MPAHMAVLAVATKRGRSRLLAAAAAVLGFIVLVPMMMLATQGTPAVASPCPPLGGGGTAPTDVNVRRNAQVIADEGIKAGVGTRGVIVALATAMQESGVRNLASRKVPESLAFPNDGVALGDHDSVNAFQQRTSQGWGTIAQLMQPTLAAQGFFGTATHTGNTGLLDIAGWETMPIASAAQAVQRSAFPDAYAKWEGPATALAKELVGDVAPSPVSTPSGTATSSGPIATGCFPGAGPEVSGEWANPMAAGSYTVTSRYGPRGGRLHAGLDMAAPIGVNVFAACTGTVTETRVRGTGGNTVVIDCGGSVHTLYRHLSAYKTQPGTAVKAGDLIGLVGNTGRSTGPHLHYEVTIGGAPANPEPWMQSRGLTL